MTVTEQIERGGYFQGYAYAYPHKTAYGPLNPSIPLREVWEAEEKDGLFLYAHVPFCEMRCGFCNLFTTTHPDGSLVARYLDALSRQAEAVSRSLGADAHFARVAIGGGTPTFLEPAELDRLFRQLESHFTIAPDAPRAVELSPATTTAERLAVLERWRVSRVSLGVQSFVEAETRALSRLQESRVARAALQLLRDANFPALNVDLIYGIRGQSAATWQESLRAAVAYRPEEVFLYPLYVRPLTGLGRRGEDTEDHRIALYRMGRDFLLAQGYRQVSMRLFRAQRYVPPDGPSYCCQEDGMVGLGAGARSYTQACHYSTEWAVGQPSVRGILQDYVERSTAQFAVADYGCMLDETEQRRRYVIKSLLRADGLEIPGYQAQFGTSPWDDFPELAQLVDGGYAEQKGDVLAPTERGLECSDVMGPWLFSARTRARMAEFELA